MLLAPAEPDIWVDTLERLQDLPDTLAAAMAEDGITGIELAATIGIGQSTMSSYLRRRSTPTLHTVECVLKWLGQR